MKRMNGLSRNFGN